jgi:polysaccharide biosynthesis protein PslF
MVSGKQQALQPVKARRVLFVTGEYPPMQGGVGDYTRELARALVRQGHLVSVLTSDKGMWTEPGITTFPTVGQWSWGLWPRLAKALRESEADILHVQYQTAAYGMYPAINLLPLRWRFNKRRPKTVITYHDLREPYLFPKAGPVRRWITYGPAHWYDAAILTNVEDCSQFSKAKLPFHLIPIGSNISTNLPDHYDRAAWRARLGVTPQETLLCYFGFLNASKGGETLIRALWELISNNRDVKLLMVGGQVGASDPTNVDYLKHIKALVEELHLTSSVLWTGFVSDEEVSGDLVAADIAVLPYRDGASFRRGSFMAALSHGLPVISTEGPGTIPLSSVPNMATSDLPCLDDCDNVLLVPPDDPGAVSRAVIRLMANPALRQRLAGNARILAEAFGWDNIARRTTEVYNSLLP